MLAATAACVFPAMLRSITNDAWSLTAYNSSVPSRACGLRCVVGIGLPLAVLYFSCCSACIGARSCRERRDGY